MDRREPTKALLPSHCRDWLSGFEASSVEDNEHSHGIAYEFLFDSLFPVYSSKTEKKFLEPKKKCPFERERERVLVMGMEISGLCRRVEL